LPQFLSKLTLLCLHMKKLASFVVLFCLFQIVCRAQKGWKPLFNGKNLKGWDIKIAGHDLNDNYLNTFRVENGMIRICYDQYKNFDNKYGHMYFKTPYSHYRLRFEYRFTGVQTPGGATWNVRNSGVMVHSQSAASMTKDQDFPVSVEVQLLGGLGTGPRTTANLCKPGTLVDIGGKPATDHCVNSTSKTYDGDQWVAVEVLVLGDSLIQHFIDGKMILEYSKPRIGGWYLENYMSEDLKKRAGEPIRDGYIALQAESHPVDFRNIELLNLKKHVKKGKKLKVKKGN
jgi:Domain of Unknown Function (DUF1080)